MQNMKKDTLMRTDIDYVVFPFTFLPRKKAAWLSDLLGPFTLIQPSEHLHVEKAQMQQDGLLQLKTPVLDKEQAIRSRIQACHGFHQGNPQNDMAFLKALAFQRLDDETLSARIRSAILRYGQKTDTPSDPVLEAMVFLTLAEEFDMQAQAIEEDMKRVDDLERDFLKKLVADDEEAPKDLLASTADLRAEDPEPHLPDERLRAWSLLAGQDPSSLPSVWLTTSRLVMESLIEVLPEPTKSIQRIVLPDPEQEESASLERWRRSCTCRIRALVNGDHGKVNEPEDLTVQFPKGWMDVYPLWNLAPAKILEFLVPKSAGAIQKPARDDCSSCIVILHCMQP